MPVELTNPENPENITEPEVIEPQATNPETVPTPEPKPETPEVKEDILASLSKVDKADLLKSEVIQNLLASARQQEKDKLYKTLEGKDEANKKLAETISDLEKQIETKEGLSMESEKELLTQIQELKDAQAGFIKSMEEEKETTRLTKLQAYRDKKIGEAQGAIIEGLVNGNSEEEIDSSVELAKAEYEKIVSPLKQQVEELGKPDRNQAPTPSNPANLPEMEFTGEQIKNMSPAEYAQYREKIIQSATGR